MSDKAKLARAYVLLKIRQMSTGEQENAVKASLARLRRGIGRPPGSMPELWEMTLRGLPEDLLSRDGQPTRGEWAVHTAMTLYALHQQGRELKKDSMHRDGIGLGTSVGSLVKKEDEDLPRVKRRFDAAVTSDSLTEFSHHLRGLIQLLRAEGIPLDYAQMTEDLYRFQFPESSDGVRLRWGQDFYRQVGKGSDQPVADNNNENEKDGGNDET